MVLAFGLWVFSLGDLLFVVLGSGSVVLLAALIDAVGLLMPFGFYTVLGIAFLQSSVAFVVYWHDRGNDV